MNDLNNVWAVVSGDLSADRGSDNYQTMVLCPECLEKYDVISEEDASEDECEGCGKASQ